MVGLDPAYPDHIRDAISSFSKDVMRIPGANMRHRDAVVVILASVEPAFH